MTRPSPTYQLIEQKLGEPLDQFVAKRRPGTAWRLIAMEIYERTDIDITYESLRTWFTDPERAA